MTKPIFLIKTYIKDPDLFPIVIIEAVNRESDLGIEKPNVENILHGTEL